MMTLALILQRTTPEPPHGVTYGETLGTLALAAIVVGCVGLLVVEFLLKDRLTRSTYRWLLLIGMLVLPGFALLGSTESMFEEMKEVSSCNSCHVMNTFVNDMKDPRSNSLAARHFRTGAIPAKQCYSCHTGYGIFGTMESKRDGFRHWLLYTTHTWKEPVTYKGSYPNANCLGCHATMPRFQRVDSHKALAGEISRNEVGCFTCHGLPHPPRPLRDGSKKVRVALHTPHHDAARAE